MRKFLLILMVLCGVMPVMAQKASDKTPSQQMKEAKQRAEMLNRAVMSYSQKLDSVVYTFGLSGGFYTVGGKTLLRYDQNLNCINSSTYYLGELDSSTDYEYDDQNRIVSIVERSSGYTDSKITMSYDDNGRITEELLFSSLEGEWVKYQRMTFEYDGQGNCTVSHTYTNMGEDSWLETATEMFIYTNGVRTESMYFSWDFDTNSLDLDTRTTWTYEGDLVVQEITYRSADGGQLVNDWRSDYEYDDHDNLTVILDYSYEEDWVLEDRTDMSYDLTVAYSDVAGYLVLFGQENNPTNKLTQMKNTDSEGEVVTMDFYYSPANHVSEDADNPWTVWPNPTSEVLHIDGDNLRQVEIFSIDGRWVMTLREGLETIDVKGLTRGSYLLKSISNDGRVATQKFVKQ